MLLNYHYIIKNQILDSSWTPFGLMLLNYHYIIIFCSRWWLPVGIAGFRLELQAFRLELPLRVVFAGFSVGIAAPGGFCRLFGWNCRSGWFLQAFRLELPLRVGGVNPPFGLMLLNYHYIIIFCSRWWLPVGIAGFSVGIAAPGGFCRLFGWNCRSGWFLQAFRLELPLQRREAPN
jgi:hypothetical protein